MMPFFEPPTLPSPVSSLSHCWLIQKYAAFPGSRPRFRASAGCTAHRSASRGKSPCLHALQRNQQAHLPLILKLRRVGQAARIPGKMHMIIGGTFCHTGPRTPYLRKNLHSTLRWMLSYQVWTGCLPSGKGFFQQAEGAGSLQGQRNIAWGFFRP